MDLSWLSWILRRFPIQMTISRKRWVFKGSFRRSMHIRGLTWSSNVMVLDFARLNFLFYGYFFLGKQLASTRVDWTTWAVCSWEKIRANLRVIIYLWIHLSSWIVKRAKELIPLKSFFSPCRWWKIRRDLCKELNGKLTLKKSLWHFGKLLKGMMLKLKGSTHPRKKIKIP